MSKFLLFFFLFITFNAFSQEQNRFIPIAVLGGNSSQVSGDDMFGFNQFGVYGGLGIKRKIKSDSHLQFQIAFSQKGSRKPVNPNSNNTQYIIRLNYIDVPIYFSKYILSKKMDNLFFEVGIINSYLINYSEKTHIGTVTPVRPFFKYELSGAIGLGYDVNKNVSFSIRMINSILPIRRHTSNAVYLWNRGQYNTVVQFTARIRLTKAKE